VKWERRIYCTAPVDGRKQCRQLVVTLETDGQILVVRPGPRAKRFTIHNEEPPLSVPIQVLPIEELAVTRRLSFGCSSATWHLALPGHKHTIVNPKLEAHRIAQLGLPLPSGLPQWRRVRE
jgi:hypothetical protein